MNNSNSFWQTLKNDKLAKKKRKFCWNILKLLIRLVIFIYNILKFFENNSSS